jgi:hypothetical protein
MANEAVRVLLPEESTRERVEAAFRRRGWHLARVFAQEQIQPAQWQWVADPDDEVSYMEDALFRWRYLVLYGPRSESIAADLRAELPTFSREEILGMWDAAWQDREAETDALVGAAHALGIGASTASDPDIMARLAYGLRIPQPEARLAVLRAIGFTQWTEFYQGLKWFAANDPDQHLRHYAEGLVLAMERSGELEKP